MANKNGNTYELHYGVKVLCDEKADVLGYAMMRSNQLEALVTLMSCIDFHNHPESLTKDVMWLASSVAEEMKQLVPLLFDVGIEEGLIRKQKAKQRPELKPVAASY